MAATATPGTGLTLTNVQFKVDDANQGAAVTTAPYNIILDTTRLPIGSHTLTAVATDVSGHSTTSPSVAITVNNAPTAVAITAPSSGASVCGANVPVTAIASPGTGRIITSVQFLVDNNKQGSAVTTSPYGIVLDNRASRTATTPAPRRGHRFRRS